MPKPSPEYIQVERPFIEQLQQLGWNYLEGDTGVPYLTGREDFRQVLLTDRLREALARVKLDENGKPWLDEARVNQAVSRLERLGVPKDRGQPGRHQPGHQRDAGRRPQWKKRHPPVPGL